MSATVNVNVSDEEDQLSEDEQHVQNAAQPNVKGSSSSTASYEIANNLLKWTNYIHGWQERYIVLRDGILSYYKNQMDTQYGCRGAITLKQSTITPHELDECRFDIRVNDCVWYLRANTSEERAKWISALEEQRVESGYGSQTSLKRHGSLLSINSLASHSIASTGSFKHSYSLKERLAEMDTYKDILHKQVDTLQTYFDACANATTKSFEPYHKEFEKMQNDDLDMEDEMRVPQSQKPRTHNHVDKARIEDHAGMAMDFKGEAFTFKATTTGILTSLSHCIELMQQREEHWRKKFEKEIEKRKKFEEMYRDSKKEKQKKILVDGPDFEEGPHSSIKEELFYDAIDNSLENLEMEEERRILSRQISVQPVKADQSIVKHKLSESIEKIVQEHMTVDRQEVTDVWDLFSSEGEMKLYRREVEENGLVLDPLKAVHTVRGVTGHEMCHYFWDPAVRMEWEHTLDSTQVIEKISDDTLIFHQLHKRVWPAAQRDSCFWSHIRSISRNEDEQPDWIVVNYSIDHEMAPSKLVRIFMNVAMTCETTIVDPPTDKNAITRDNLMCKITYVSQINPGGWAPASALRAIFKREYPRFLKRFTKYVIDTTANKPIFF